MPAIQQELAIAIGYKKQTGTGVTGTTAAELQTALSSGDLWTLNQDNFAPPFPTLNQEDDSLFFGKGDEFARTQYPTSIDVTADRQFFLTSQQWAQISVFASGKTTETNPDSAGMYVSTLQDRGIDGVNLPATTIVAGIRQGTAGEMLDIAYPGCVCTGWELSIKKGPGLQNTRLTSTWMGCGKYIQNSGIAIPALRAETRLGSGAGTVLLINDVDYLANTRFNDLTLTYSSGFNADSGFYLGSGQQDGYDIRGRARVGVRSLALKWTGELESDSVELDQLKNGVEGAFQLKIEGPTIAGMTKHLLQVDLPRTRHKGIQLQESDGWVAQSIETTILKDSSLPFMTLTAVTDQTGIGSEA